MYALQSLIAQLGTQGVVGNLTTSNHIMETVFVLGIEVGKTPCGGEGSVSAQQAARTSIMNEIAFTMARYSLIYKPLRLRYHLATDTA